MHGNLILYIITMHKIIFSNNIKLNLIKNYIDNLNLFMHLENIIKFK